MNRTNEAKRRLMQANHLLGNRDYRAVLNLLRTPAELFLDDGAAWQLRGLAHFGLREITQAMAAFEYASVLVPLSPLAQCRLAECYQQRRQRELARLVYLHLATLEQLPCDIVETVAGGLSRCGELDQALEFCLAGLRQYRGSHQLLHTAAGLMRRLGHTNDEILPFAYQAYHLRPDMVAYALTFAQHLLAADRRREAGRVLRQVALDDQQCVATLQRLQSLFEHLGDDTNRQRCRDRLQLIGYELATQYRPAQRDGE